MLDANSVEIGDPYESLVTVTVGYALFGAYNWITVIVLLNMLIAMMARSYEFIEVKYALRTLTSASWVGRWASDLLNNVRPK